MKYLDRTLVQLPLFLGLCRDEKAFRKELKRLKVPKDQWPAFVPGGRDACAHFFESGREVTCVITLGPTKGRTKVQVLALLVHEAVHVWRQVREQLGETEPSAEFEAYAIQNLAQTLMEAL